MIARSLTVALALSAWNTPGRNARPPAGEATAGAVEAAPQDDLTDEQVADRVRTYLGAIDTPIRAERWRALGPRAVPVLEGIARDVEALPTRRAKAVGALSVLGGKRARQTVLDMARSEKEPFAIRASALDGAGHMLAAKDLLRELKPVLERAGEAPVRAAAANVLARHAGRTGCGAVRAQASREGEEHRPSFARALERCRGAPP